jgi:hypothetical protein
MSTNEGMAYPVGQEPGTGAGRGPAVARRAGIASRIFDALAWIVLVIGGIGAVVWLVGGAVSGDGASGVVVGLLMAAAWLLVTALYWAAITALSVVVGYIAQKAER